MERRRRRRPVIGIESTALSWQPATGVSLYSREVLRRVFALRPEWDFVLTRLRTEPGLAEWLSIPNVRERRSPYMLASTYHKLFFRRVRLPYDLSVGLLPDVWVFPRFVRFPVRPSTPSMTFVYDLSFEVVPECADDRNRTYLGDNVPRSVARSTKVLTISDYVTQELVEHYGMPRDKAFRAYPAVDHRRFHVPEPAAIEATLQRHGLERGYVLSVGTLEPRKNVDRLVHAWQGLAEKVRRVHPLVLVGANGWLNDELERQLAPLIASGEVKRLGYVADEDLAGLYAGAGAFAYLSRYEGFGMPVLEALACGAACVVAGNSSLLEAGGDAVRFVDHRDLEDIRAGLSAVLLDEDVRQALTTRAANHVARFDWEASAQSVVDEIERMLAAR